MRARNLNLASRTAFTLIELLVCLGILTVLISLVLPAVQSAREAARRSRCANHLGQLIRATHAYQVRYGGFPPSAFWGRPLLPGDSTVRHFAVHCLLLPDLEQNHLFNGINFWVVPVGRSRLDGPLETVASQRIEVFLCPSDPNPRPGRWAANSYRACTGLAGRELRPDGTSRLAYQGGAFAPVDRDGTFRAVLPLASFRDGLSNTLAFSEKPIGSRVGDPYSPFRDWRVRHGATQVITPDDWVRACSRLSARDVQEPTRVAAGESWLHPGAITTHFFATAPPNTTAPDCGTYTDGGFGLFSARSYHPGGVNAAMADGSVRWIQSGIALHVWRALGTRAGGEITED